MNVDHLVTFFMWLLVATTEIHFKTCFCAVSQDLGPPFFQDFFFGPTMQAHKQWSFKRAVRHICDFNLEMRENEILLRKHSGDTADLHCCAPQRKRWCSSFKLCKSCPIFKETFSGTFCFPIQENLPSPVGKQTYACLKQHFMWKRSFCNIVIKIFNFLNISDANITPISTPHIPLSSQNHVTSFLFSDNYFLTNENWTFWFPSSF